jgi:LCP family protein required for cell wall assembly
LKDDEAPNAAQGRSLSLAAVLSFLWPGLGQLYAGNRRLAAIFAGPSLVVLAIAAYALRQGPAVFAARFADPTFALGGLAIVLALGGWRLAAVIEVLLNGKRLKSHRTIDVATVTGLAVIVVAMHMTAGYMLAVSYQADVNAFNPNNALANQLGFNESPSPLAAANASPNPAESPTPTAAPVGPNQRVTMLFLGVDSSIGTNQCDRGITNSYNADMAVSYDPRTNTIGMMSIPREWAGFPMYYGGPNDRIGLDGELAYLPNNVHNGFVSPDSPPLTIVKEEQFLLGVKIDYYTVMNLAGFMKTIDALGGIDIVNSATINDPVYDNLNCGPHGFYLTAGPHHLDGAQALAYVAAREGSVGGGSNSDYLRISRQQQVMLALLHKMASPSEVLQIPGLIQTVGSSIVTGALDPAKPFEPSMIADYVNLAESVPNGNISQVVLQPNTYAFSNLAGWGASICPNLPAVAKESIAMFGQDSLYYGKPAPKNVC